jgi:hypothetical protein
MTIPRGYIAVFFGTLAGAWIRSGHIFHDGWYLAFGVAALIVALWIADD